MSRKSPVSRQFSLNSDTESRRKTLRKQFSEDLPDQWLLRRTIKLAWDDPSCEEDLHTDPSVIIKKYQDLKPFTPQTSPDPPKPPQPEKTNLKIFLANNIHEEDPPHQKFIPKLIQPLLETDKTKELFTIRRDKTAPKSSAIMVPGVAEPPSVPKPIETVIIRPSTAANKRQMFKNRTNSAFNSTVQDTPPPPLVRSSSAPLKPDPNKSKFLINKRKLKVTKRQRHHKQHEEVVDEGGGIAGGSDSAKVDIVTMVSLVSPAGSDDEDGGIGDKKHADKKAGKVEEKDVPRGLSLRKIGKSVSFQQSTIHAIRSFSASFPSRRNSLATALAPKMSKGHEKRATNVDSEEQRGPKRRLVRCHSEDVRITHDNEVEDPLCSTPILDCTSTPNPITVEVQRKIATPDLENKNEEVNEQVEVEVDPKPKFESAKEKQCWQVFCKMTEKGVNVSYDTILRGMLTPTEYRMSRKNSLVALASEETQKCTF